MSSRSRLFDWRAEILSERGPPEAMTRYVLLVLSQHMNGDGDSCFPSIDTVAFEAALSEKSVRTHLERAAGEGWIERWTGSTSKGWRRYQYRATFHSRGDGAAVGGSAPCAPLVHNKRGHGAEPHADGAVSHDLMVRKEVPTRTPSRTSIKSSKRTSVPRDEKKGKQRAPST